MARLRRNSRELDILDSKIEAMKKINPALDPGFGITVAACTQFVNTVRSLIADHNKLIEQVDISTTNLNDYEKKANEMSSNIRKAACISFGADSLELEIVGGTRRSNFKRHTKKASKSLQKAS